MTSVSITPFHKSLCVLGTYANHAHLGEKVIGDSGNGLFIASDGVCQIHRSYPMVRVSPRLGAKTKPRTYPSIPSVSKTPTVNSAEPKV
jgi:hypothetical protein